MNAPLTPRDIAAMTAHAAAIKAENDVHTQGLLTVRRHGDERAAYLLNDQSMAVARCINTDLENCFEANARRLAACWNACAGVPTETLELAASWGDIVKGVMGGARISAEAAAVGAGLDGESLEQGEPS